MTKKTLIVVHDDGETWVPAELATVVEVTEGQWKRLEEGTYPKHLRNKLKGSPIDKLLEYARAHGWEG